jgi:hypothetical protein
MVSSRLKQLLEEPLLHFLLIGACIYLLYGMYANDADNTDARVITVSARDIQSLQDQWQRVWSRPPTEAELARAINAHVRVKILHREALGMGLDAGDTVIERRLAQKVELLARSLITPEEPTLEQLEGWYASNEDRFKQPDLYTLTQIYFSPDERGDATLDDALNSLDQLNRPGKMPTEFSEYGDAFVLRNHYEKRTELQLRKLFGTGFVDQIVNLETGVWHGPLLSGYGAHLVMINEVVRSTRPALDEVMDEIKNEWLAEQIDQLSERFVSDLISRYEIDIEANRAPIEMSGSNTP